MILKVQTLDDLPIKVPILDQCLKFPTCSSFVKKRLGFIVTWGKGKKNDHVTTY